METKKEEPEWKRELFNLIGVASLFLGIILIITSKTVTTGNAIISEIITKQFSIIGIMLFIGGVIVLFTSSIRSDISDLERRAEGDERDRAKGIKIYSKHSDPEKDTFVPDRDLHIIEPQGMLGVRDYSLGEFRKRYKELGDDELKDVAKEELGPGLLSIYNHGNNLAKYFLEAMNVTIPRTNEKPRVIISNKALVRARRDNSVSGRAKMFNSEIEMIRENPIARPKERIGEFFVSPRGRKEIRVAWDYDPEKNIIKIYDVLYHTGTKEYVDDWNNKSRTGELSKKSYESAGFSEFRGIN
ncbi:MAG: hypothetical protein AABW73_02570 [Nanoarchaeota archaeon]